jgi:hypothetical protein
MVFRLKRTKHQVEKKKIPCTFTIALPMWWKFVIGMEIKSCSRRKESIEEGQQPWLAEIHGIIMQCPPPK